MAGIYIHIPFCKQACHYCDFHFSTNHSRVEEVVDAICKELKARKTYLSNAFIHTIYYGGGTPSVLTKVQIDKIQTAIYEQFMVTDDVEITFECNPDDLTEDYLKILKGTGINRLSIGIQSFNNTVLTSLNRAHNANEATNCVKLAKKIGFDNMTIDLIYGLPDTDITYWQTQIRQALDLGITHISAYSLTYESGTVFGNWLKKDKINPLSDSANLAQFKALVSNLTAEGFEHYEISNFAKNGHISRHNSAYWLGATYLGLGPSAHSYNGSSRQWNIANNAQYIKKINEDLPHFEIEELTEKDQFNEYLLTRLRTKWGLEKSYLAKQFPQFYPKMLKNMSVLIANGNISETDSHFYITPKGKFIADHLTGELFVI